MRKKYAILIATIYFVQLNIQAIDNYINQPSGTISVLNSAYDNGMCTSWHINTGTNNKPVKITYTVNTEENHDYLYISSFDISGSQTSLLITSGLNKSGSFTTGSPSGRFIMSFSSDASSNYASNPLYTGFTVNFEVDNSDISVFEASQTEFYGTDIALPTANMLLDGTDTGRTVGKGPSLNFSMPSMTNGTGNCAQARILATPDNANNGDASGRLYMQVRDKYNPTGIGGTWNWRTGLMIAANGNVGIGTTTPSLFAKLDVKGDIQISNKIGINLYDKITDTNNPYNGLSNYSQAWISDPWTTTGYTLWQSAWGGMKFFTNGTPRLSITNDGKVSIGTTDVDNTPNVLLTVKGSIHVREVVVDLNAPIADYVFKSTYKLMPLNQVEQYVKTNSHLPEIPSAAEVSKNGLSMGEMQNKLLQKVEELTLYVIEQQKRIEMLEKSQK